jgi:hypothetical protein
VAELGPFCTERAKRRPKFWKVCSLLLFSAILGKSKKYYTFPTDKDKDIFVSKAQMPSKITKGHN